MSTNFTQPNLTQEEIHDALDKAEQNKALGDLRDAIVESEARAEKEERPNTTRRVIVIGCGDGGCNVSTLITKNATNSVFTIAYNTSKHNMRDHLANRKEQFTGTGKDGRPIDGSGKDRDYSKMMFRSMVPTTFKDIKEGINTLKVVDYFIITTTVDGGTGSGMSAVLAKLLQDNATHIPVVLVGIYPTMSDDAMSMKNALDWQREVIKAKVPYIILDNNIPYQKAISNHETVKIADIHREVNEQAMRAALLLIGSHYGPSTIGIIDRQNLYKLVREIPGRIVATSSNVRPAASQSLDDYVETMLADSCQPAPSKLQGIGVWVKGPKNTLAQMDTSLIRLQQKYGEATLKFAHVEESDDTEIGILLSGCDEVRDRMVDMRHRFDDIRAQGEKEPSCIDELMDGLDSPIMSTVERMSDKTEDQNAELDMSAFDL